MKYIAAFFSFFFVWFVVAFIISVIIAVLLPASGPIAAGIVISPDSRTWPGMACGFLAGIHSAKSVFTRLAHLSGTATSPLKAAAILLIAYAVIFTFDSLINLQQRGFTVYWGRIFTYVPVVLFLSWGLWQAKRWAWIGSIIFTALFGVMGILTLIAYSSVRSNNYQRAHHTVVDWSVVIAMNIIFFAAFVLLLSPSSRRALQEAA